MRSRPASGTCVSLMPKIMATSPLSLENRSMVGCCPPGVGAGVGGCGRGPACVVDVRREVAHGGGYPGVKLTGCQCLGWISGTRPREGSLALALQGEMTTKAHPGCANTPGACGQGEKVIHRLVGVRIVGFKSLARYN